MATKIQRLTKQTPKAAVSFIMTVVVTYMQNISTLYLTQKTSNKYCKLVYYFRDPK